MKKLLIFSSFVLQYTCMFAMEKQLQQSKPTIISQRYNLFFIGESCAGKTTLMQQLAMLCTDEFFMPKFTVTRSPRLDDDPNLIEFVTVTEYISSRESGEFIFDMDDGKTFYGYKKKNLHFCDKHALLYGSPYFVEQSRKIENALLILIEADKEKGFLTRQDSNNFKENRKQSNKQLSEVFFNNDNFRQKMDLIYYNKFGDCTESAKQLLHELHIKFLNNES